MTRQELLQNGMNRLDDALSYLMELKDDRGKALAGIVYGAVVFGEHLEKAAQYANPVKPPNPPVAHDKG